MNRPIPLTKEDLGALLLDMAERVIQGDSYEGSIEYSMPTEEDDP